MQLRNVVVALGAWVLAAGCSSGPTTTGGGPDGGTTSGGPDGVGSSGSSGSSGSTGGLPSACPCPVESYCELTTNTCKPGCTTNTECTPGRYCDTVARTCKAGCQGDTECNGADEVCESHACIKAANCTSLTQLGTSVSALAAAGTAPQPLGGTIVNGKYTLTSTKVYGGTSAPGTVISVMGKETLELTTGGLADVATNPGGVENRAKSTTTANGSSLFVTPTCTFPAATTASFTLPYTATPTTFKLYRPLDPGLIELIYTKL